MQSPLGFYKLKFEEAGPRCADRGTVIALPDDLLQSWVRGLSWCACGWLSDSAQAFVLDESTTECADMYRPGLILCDLNMSNVWCVLP